MSRARDIMHERHCRWLRCAHNEYRLDGAISEECAVLDARLDQVEDDRVHREAEKLRKRGEELKAAARNQGVGMAMAAALLVESIEMDPYEERDGQLVRKSDGRPVVL